MVMSYNIDTSTDMWPIIHDILDEKGLLDNILILIMSLLKEAFKV